MQKASNNWCERGSEWHRWDPHIHAPGTVMADEFGGDWENYIKAIEAAVPTVKALGVTDYCSIETYRAVRAWKAKGRLPGAEFIFPNVEMRLDIKTAQQKGLNIHLIFSPDDPDHEQQIERVLGYLTFEFLGQPYRCNRGELISLGRKYNPKQTDDNGAFREGVNQFKVVFKELRKLRKEDAWVRENCLVAVDAGEVDGTSGLKADGAFTATREELERFSNFIFSGTPSDRDFWLGKMSLDREAVEKKYHCLKPCLHGSDAHKLDRVAAPVQKRYCWIKGDLSFETLRQVVVEPEERVWIGEESPEVESITISKIRAISTPWLADPEIPLNNGLVSIIGARGSGKTALVDLIAAGAHSLGKSLGESSFLLRATTPDDLIGDAQVEEEWADGSKNTVPFRPPEPWDEEFGPEVHYLSQHFVDRLCSSAGLATELREEIERVIFEQTEPTERYETDSFKALSELLLQPILHRRELHAEAIVTNGTKIADEDRLREQLPKLKIDYATLEGQVKKAQKELGGLLPKGQEARTKRLLELEEACTQLATKVENIARRKNALEDLLAETKIIEEQTEPERLFDMKSKFSEAGLKETEWEAFRMKFSGDIAGIISAAKKAADKESQIISAGDPTNPVDTSKAPFLQWPLVSLQAERDKVKKEVGIDAAKKQRYDTLQKSITTNQATLKRMAASIAHARGADARRKELIQARRDAYKSAFETLVEESAVLTKLYEPLGQQIKGAEGALAKLSFVVKREVRFDAWVEEGEKLMDLRKETRFRGHGALKDQAKALLPVWRTGTPEQVASAMHDFVEEFKPDLLQAVPPSVTPEDKLDWFRQVGEWLYGTNHISVRYGIEYGGVAVEQLSPGTRGIVLLLLYLAVDRTDRRPLLIDQPEENLDPKSVFEDLVPHFREARKRRQVIIVTHNANLVVNTDADQVIVATCDPATSGKLPTIHYSSGSLENPNIRRSVCGILEGGERAFLERERRYRLQWEQMLQDGE